MAITAPVQEAIRKHMARRRERRVSQAEAVSQAVGGVLSLVMLPQPGLTQEMQELLAKMDEKHG